MIKVYSLSKDIAGIPLELGLFLNKEDAIRLQTGYKDMYNEELILKERKVYNSIMEVETDE